MALTSEDICRPGYRVGRCARSVVHELSGLFINKTILAATLVPVAYYIGDWLEVKVRQIRQRRSRGDAHQADELRQRAAERNRADLFALVATNAELAIVLGPVIPLLVPLCSLAMFSMLVSRALAVRRLGVQIADGVDPAIPWFLGLCCGWQAILTCVIFLDTQLQGWPLTAVGIIALLSLIWWNRRQTEPSSVGPSSSSLRSAPSRLWPHGDIDDAAAEICDMPTPVLRACSWPLYT